MENVPDVLEKDVYSVVIGKSIPYVSDRCSWFIVLFRSFFSSVYHFIFYLEEGIELSNSCFGSVHFSLILSSFLIHFDGLLWQMFTIANIETFKICNALLHLCNLF